jgi:hypothetical protein
MPTAQDGWSRLGYNVGAWNTTPDALANVTGQSLETQVDFGGYWNADEWSSGAWNIGHGAVLTGTGNVFAISTLTQLTANVGNVVTIANANISISGQLTNVSLSNVVVLNEAIVNITGEDLTANLGLISIAAGGSITIQTGAEIALDVSVGNVATGTANRVDITGFELNTGLGNVTLVLNNIIPITGSQANVTANTVAIRADQVLSLTGNSITTFVGNVIANSNNFISITGQTANVTVATLKFWDNIDTSTNSEVWTHIVSNTNAESWTNIH